MSDNAFGLGAKVIFTKTLRRCKNRAWADKMHPDSKKLILPRLTGYYRYPSFWVETDPTPDPVHGIIVGKKTLSDGITTYDRDEGNEYRSVRSFTAWEVAFNLHRKPVLVLHPQPWFTFTQIEYEVALHMDVSNGVEPKLMRRPKPAPWEEVDDPKALKEALIAAAKMNSPEGVRL